MLGNMMFFGPMLGSGNLFTVDAMRGVSKPKAENSAEDELKNTLKEYVEHVDDVATLKNINEMINTVLDSLSDNEVVIMEKAMYLFTELNGKFAASIEKYDNGMINNVTMCWCDMGGEEGEAKKNLRRSFLMDLVLIITQRQFALGERAEPKKKKKSKKNKNSLMKADKDNKFGFGSSFPDSGGSFRKGSENDIPTTPQPQLNLQQYNETNRLSNHETNVKTNVNFNKNITHNNTINIFVDNKNEKKKIPKKKKNVKKTQQMVMQEIPMKKYDPTKIPNSFTKYVGKGAKTLQRLKVDTTTMEKVMSRRKMELYFGSSESFFQQIEDLRRDRKATEKLLLKTSVFQLLLFIVKRMEKFKPGEFPSMALSLICERIAIIAYIMEYGVTTKEIFAQIMMHLMGKKVMIMGLENKYVLGMLHELFELVVFIGMMATNHMTLKNEIAPMEHFWFFDLEMAKAVQLCKPEVLNQPGKALNIANELKHVKKNALKKIMNLEVREEVTRMMQKNSMKKFLRNQKKK